MKEQATSSPKRSIVRKFILLLWVGVLSIILFFTGIMLAVSNGLFGELPSPEVLENPKSFLATEIYSADGVVLGNFYRENRTIVPFDSLSPTLVNALVATEDRRYWDHAGIDLMGLGRVFVKSFLMGQSESSGGGSTLTQQLAKNLFHKRPENIWQRIPQKLKEWVIATRLERRYTKEEVLAMYLNTVEFVNNAHGIKSACKVYFNTTPSLLTTPQAALLVGMVKNPSLYNPIRFPERALGRRNTVIDQMVKYGYLENAEADSLKTLELGLDYHKVDHNTGLAPYFREHLRLFVRQWARENPKPDGTFYDIYSDGLKIYTTIDSRMQQYAEEAVREHMSSLQKDFFQHWAAARTDPWRWDSESERYNPNWLDDKVKRSERYRAMKEQGIPEDSILLAFNTPVSMTVFDWNSPGQEKDTMMSPRDSIRYVNYFLQAGFSVLDPKTGELLAWVGGINHQFFQLDHVTSRRQVGSTFKPFVYAAAITELGYSPCLKFPNVDYPNPRYDNWAPRNSGDYKEGEMLALWDALAHSVNKITAKLMLDLGDPNNVISLMRKMGIKSEIPPYPSISLGACELTLEEMVGSYTSFANRGYYSKPFFITEIRDKYDNVIARFGQESTEVLSAEQADVMLYLLQQTVSKGTGARLRFKYKLEMPLAGKTGTTQDNTDGWFMGITPELVGGVWVGGDDPVFRFRSTALGQGANMALPIFGIFLQKAYADETLGLSEETPFPEYTERRTIETDCEKYEDMNNDDYNQLDPYSGQLFNMQVP